ncbi:hypothetical protein [Bradyrhizobium jicamae]|uniref:hypothetical protein n=1 Tax=Bradyrhizobium jicamae TaxID=280332 RepID=UPI001BAAEC49|nr:hypothetical protein [Bradyrhizobium jicamae]MBR0938778.1 hypothetical protein [Bradyrhizobium jicamae]
MSIEAIERILLAATSAGSSLLRGSKAAPQSAGYGKAAASVKTSARDEGNVSD